MSDTPNSPIGEVQTFVETSLLRGRRVARDEDLLLSGLLDSLAVMSLVAEVERVSGQPVPPADVTIENFATLEAIGAYLARGDGP